MTPPAGNHSDEDFAPSDGDDADHLHHLSKNQLLASCELQLKDLNEQVSVISDLSGIRTQLINEPTIDQASQSESHIHTHTHTHTKNLYSW